MKSLLTDVKRPYYGASDLVEAITTSKGPLDAWIQNGVYKNLLQLKTGVFSMVKPYYLQKHKLETFTLL